MESIKQIAAKPGDRDPKASAELTNLLERIAGPIPADLSESPTSSSIECGKCLDAGTIARDGKRFDCECRIEKRIRYQLPVRYQQARLKDFSAGIVREVTAWLEKPTDGLFLAGGVGTGKTHLAAAIVRHEIERGKRQVYFRPASVLFQAIRDSYKDEGRTEASILADYTDARLLVLDDLGAGNLSDHERRYTLEVLDRRLNNMRPTIVTSNWTLKDIAEKLDERVASRLSGFKVIAFKGEDKRTAKSKEHTK